MGRLNPYKSFGVKSMESPQKIAFIFPGQGAHYPGMGKDFFSQYAIARQTFEEADDILGRGLSKIIFEGPEAILTETRNSQAGIYVMSIALLRVLNQLFPHIKPEVCAGLSLGEYTAATAAGILSYQEGLPLVQFRGEAMNEACEATQGTMAVIIGLDADIVEEMVKKVNLPNDLWAANFNCPGQVVISGTARGIEAGSAAAKELGAKRVLPLQVHGAFHSGLMKRAEECLKDKLSDVKLNPSQVQLVMNVTGKVENHTDVIRSNLIKQVTSPVRWEQGIRTMAADGANLYIEIGCGKTLAGMNKRIGVIGRTVSIEKVEDLVLLEKLNG